MKKKEKKKLEREEIRDLLNQFGKKYGVSLDFIELLHDKKIKFYTVLPKDFINSAFLFLAGKRIAENYKWSTWIQESCPEDDPDRISKWCELSKCVSENINEEKIELLVKEAKYILDKSDQAKAKWRKQVEEAEKRAQKETDRMIDKFIIDLR